MKIEEIKEQLHNDIITNPKLYPFISNFWEIDLINEIESSESQTEVKFGHYDTKSNKSIPFYKPISKIIDLSEFL